jgi:hypothetical protein
MDVGRILKWLAVVAVAIVLWKVALPWAKKQNFFSSGSTSTAATSDGGCIRGAQRASDRWGTGLSQFINPPYDLSAWASFRSDVDARIAAAESDCACSADSCEKARSALRELRSLVSALDSSIRAGSAPPGDIVQRQEAIDDRLSEAADLARSGK